MRKTLLWMVPGDIWVKWVFGQVVAANNSIMIIVIATVNSLVDIVGDAYIETGPEGSFVWITQHP